MFEQFVDIGNFKKDLKLYQPLVESFYKLSKEELEILKQQIKSCNQSQTPTNYINEYAVFEIIGSGAFGRVYKVKKKNTNYFLAMKEINTYNLNSMKDKSLGEIVNEVTIIRNNLKHPNIVRYLKTFKENDSLYIVMELIDGTPLSQHVRTLKEKNEFWNEEKIWNLFIQIVLALKYLHKEKHIVHRDLTSNNIMLSENEKITITDFGLAKLKESDCSKMLSVVGTMFYSCPEIIKNEPYNEKADIWALGCVLYEMCCLEPPFCTSNMLALATKITQSDYDHMRLNRNSYSSQIATVVQNCLIIDPNKRPDIVSVAAIIAEKILTYTDSIRYKCVNLEKKLEKEKNKTQRYFCNKQDLNYYAGGNSHVHNQRNAVNNNNNNNNTSSTNNNSIQQKNKIVLVNNDNEEQQHIGSSTSSGSNKSSAQSQTSSSNKTTCNNNDNNNNNNKPRSYKSSSNKNSENVTDSIKIVMSNNNSSPAQVSVSNMASSPINSANATTAAAAAAATATSSPNAKLPPLRHPKSKLLMKNIQNKQQQQLQLQQQMSLDQNQLVSSNSNNITSTLPPPPPPPSSTGSTNLNVSTIETISNDIIINSINDLGKDQQQQQQQQQPQTNSIDKSVNHKITRSSSSSVLEKRNNQSKKSRPNSANSPMVPVYKKLRPIEDPIIQILDQIHKILFIAQLPPSGKKNFKRKLVDRYKRSLFGNKKSSIQIKAELMKLIKNSNELIDNEMIGLKNFQYCFNSSDSNSTSAVEASKDNLSNNNNNNETYSCELDMILNQNSITYEQLQNIIEELLVENNYQIDNGKHFREDLPSLTN